MLCTLLLLALPAQAHITLWDKSLFGYNRGPVTNDREGWLAGVANPLRADHYFTTAEWFGHGQKRNPPPAGEFLDLPSGGTLKTEVACDMQFTSLRKGDQSKPLPEYACPNNPGAMHTLNKLGETPDPMKFGGTALAIAYTSDVDALRPQDMTVISVNYTSVWKRAVEYRIPANMPPCPRGGCLCTWNWMHRAEGGYSSEMYNSLYRCTVTGKTSSAHEVPNGPAPFYCDGKPQDCVRGPKQPMYMYQKDGNNMDGRYGDRNLRTDPPQYNARYGFKDGAQDEAVVLKQR